MPHNVIGVDILEKVVTVGRHPNRIRVPDRHRPD